MANRVAWLSKRVKIGGEWLVRQPVVKSSGFITEKVRHNNKEVYASGTFVLEWYEDGRRQRSPIEGGPTEADAALKAKLSLLQARANGIQVVEPEAKSKKHLVSVAIDAYISELRDVRERTPKTIKGVQQLLAPLEAQYLEDLKKDDIVRGLLGKLRAFGYSKQTCFDRFAKMVSFLKWCRDAERGWPAPLVHLKDGPDKPRSKIKMITPFAMYNLRWPKHEPNGRPICSCTSCTSLS